MQMRFALAAALLCGLSLPVGALVNSDFSAFGTGWTVVTSGSGSVNFDGSVATLTAFTTSGAGVEQAETLFTTPGQEFEMSVDVLNNGNIEAGWRNASSVVFASTIYASGATGTRTVRCDDPAFNVVFVEKTGAVGGIINIDNVAATEITAPPTYPGAAGIASATRTGPTEASLTWNAAVDNVTPAGQIGYNVYWSTTPANVIAEGVKASFIGVTSGTVSGIPSGQVFFTVRAVDRVGNEETNTGQISLDAVTSTDGWSLYR